MIEKSLDSKTEFLEDITRESISLEKKDEIEYFNHDDINQLLSEVLTTFEEFTKAQNSKLKKSPEEPKLSEKIAMGLKRSMNELESDQSSSDRSSDKASIKKSLKKGALSLTGVIIDYKKP